MSYTYLFLDIAIIIFPLLLAFHKKIRYYQHFLPLLISILVVGTIFIFQDIRATVRSDWDFNPLFTLGLTIAGLPLEELLFFIVVPFSTIFIYEAWQIFFPEREVSFHPLAYLVIGTILVAMAFLNTDRSYTFWALFCCGALLWLAPLFKEVFWRSSYWAYLGISFVMFFIFNLILTALPVVRYNPQAISGWRILTIPAEDFLYNFLLLTAYIAVYLVAKNKLIRRNS